MIQSQASLPCASCARSLGSGNRCPGGFWSGVLVLLLPSFSSLFIGQEVNQLSELYHASCSLLWQLPRFGLKISFKKASCSSFFSSITTSSRGLLVFFMEFLSSALMAEVSLQKNLQRRGPGGYLILHNCL